MSFKKNKYQIIKEAIPKDMANFIFNYMMLQQDAVYYMTQNKFQE